jgi:hypothetical protein
MICENTVRPVFIDNSRKIGIAEAYRQIEIDSRHYRPYLVDFSPIL